MTYAHADRYEMIRDTLIDAGFTPTDIVPDELAWVSRFDAYQCVGIFVTVVSFAGEAVTVSTATRAGRIDATVLITGTPERVVAALGRVIA